MENVKRFLEAMKKEEGAKSANIIFEPGRRLAGSIPISILPASLAPLLTAIGAQINLFVNLAGDKKNESHQEIILGIYGLLHILREIFMGVQKIQPASANKENMELLRYALEEVTELTEF